QSLLLLPTMKALLLLLVVVAIEAKRRRFPHPSSYYASTSNSEITYSWTEYWFNTKLDNFDFTNVDTFNIRYLVNMDSYKDGGPIFFYTGNEGVIEEFANATGLMWDLAPNFNAAVILAEHRYYGKSQPFGPVDGDQSYASAEKLAYLSSEQALADYAALLGWLKSTEVDKKRPVTFSTETKVIAFGGSYGGMLSAWFRMKYPHVVDGAYASSAPVLYFNNAPGVDWGGFDKITTDTFRNSGCDNEVIAKSWDSIKKFGTTDEGRDFLNKVFNVDMNKSPVTSPADADALNDYVREGIEYMAMTDYSYPTDFLKPMPASPVKYACSKYLPAGSGLTDDKKIAEAMAGIASVYFNYNDPTYKVCFKDGCGDAGTDALGSPLGWPWQECTELPMTMCARGDKNDFFWNECKTDPITLMKNDCIDIFKDQKWKVEMLGVNAVATEYGYSWNGVTNVILTNGELDPWRAGGVQYSDQSRRLFATQIINSAHHFDLRQPNTCDPSNLPWIRYQAVKAMWCFIDSGKCTDDLDIVDNKPSTMPSDTTNCKDIIGGYPWAQSSTQAIFSFTTLLVVIASIFRM
ncbi:hypothetical protein PENTCL1PPCAC_11177, partial [Pristionchus entomophagus]